MTPSVEIFYAYIYEDDSFSGNILCIGISFLNSKTRFPLFCVYHYEREFFVSSNSSKTLCFLFTRISKLSASFCESFTKSYTTTFAYAYK